MHCVRQSLLCTNLLLLTLGVVVVTICGMLLYSNEEQLEWIEPSSVGSYTLLILFLVFANLFMLTAMMGFCAVCRSNQKCLYFYSFLLLTILLVEVAIGFLVVQFYTSGEFRDNTQSFMESSFSKYSYNENSAANKLWNTYQAKMECCGVAGPFNWIGHNGRTGPPESCCKKFTMSDQCVQPYSDGCLDATLQAIETKLLVLQVTFISLFVVHIVQFVLSCCAISATKQNTEFV